MTSNSKIVPVVLSGGAGTRLWPLSRELYPKQLLPLVGERTMLQETVLRLEGLVDLGSPLVVCNEAHRFMVAEQLRQVEQAAETVILEPVGRNTAPAVAVAALQAMADGSDPLLLILAADHVIRDAEALCTAVTNGVDAVQNGSLLTFGIVPTAPETGYGYIRRGALSASSLQPQPQTSTMSKNSLKNLIWLRLKSIWRAETITGTAACSSLKLRSILRSLRKLRQRCWLPAARPGRGGRLTLILPVSIRRLSQPAPLIPSTMR